MPELPGAGRLDAETLAAYIDGLLPPEERARVEAEIATDPESYEWVVNSVNAVDDATIASAGEPVRGDTPAPIPGPESTPGPLTKDGSGGGGKVLPFYRRRAVQGMLGTVLAAAAALVLVVRTQPTWWQGVWGHAADPRFAKLVEAVGEERYIEARLTGGFKYGPLRQVMRGRADLSPDLGLLRSELLADDPKALSSLHLSGVLGLLSGDLDGAAETLAHALSIEPRPSIAQDLAAACLSGALLSRDAAATYLEFIRSHGGATAETVESLASPLPGGDRARLAASTELLRTLADTAPTEEVLFNLALALRLSGRDSEAQLAAQRYLKVERDSGWRKAVAESVVVRP